MPFTVTQEINLSEWVRNRYVADLSFRRHIDRWINTGKLLGGSTIDEVTAFVGATSWTFGDGFGDYVLCWSFDSEEEAALFKLKNL